MIFGALRSLRASSNAIGVAISPRRRSGGVSSGIDVDFKFVLFFENGAKTIGEPLFAVREPR